MTPGIKTKHFEFKNPTYKQRSDANAFPSQKITTTYHIIISTQHLAPKLRKQILENIKTCELGLGLGLKSFKQQSN